MQWLVFTAFGRHIAIMTHQIKALLFDVFGTVVDWRSSIIAELDRFFTPRGIHRDWDGFILDWRAMYQPAMDAVRSGQRDFVILDTLHRENLLALTQRYDLAGLSDQDIDALTRMWHRLTPWDDTVPGMVRLRRQFRLASLSNANVALMVDLVRFGGLPFDAILGAEFTKSYKPDPKTYLGSAAALGLAPGECMMVAAHNGDLAAARALGFRTAFVLRPTEYGAGQTDNLTATADWDYIANSMTDLADQLHLPA